MMTKQTKPKVKVKHRASRDKERPSATPNVSPEMKQLLSTLVAAKASEAFETLVVAGAHVLQEQYGWSKEQTADWADATARLGGFYLRLANKERGDETAVRGEEDEPQQK